MPHPTSILVSVVAVAAAETRRASVVVAVLPVIVDGYVNMEPSVILL
jgi:hypothetical protein